MKKQFLNLGKALNKAEQKQIFGGTISEEVEEGAGGTCGYRHPSGATWCNLSRSQAEGAANNMGGNWCCDSCGTYCN